MATMAVDGVDEVAAVHDNFLFLSNFLNFGCVEDAGVSMFFSGSVEG